MRDFHLVEATADHDAAVEWVHRLNQEVCQEIHGEELPGSLAGTRLNLVDSSAQWGGIVLAVPGPAPSDGSRGRFGLPLANQALTDVWGCATFHLPQLDNQHLIDDVFLRVRADRRRRGIGTELVAQLRRIAEADHRTAVLMWSEHRPDTDAEDWAIAPGGEGRLPLDAGSVFAASQGFSLAQVERQSRLALPTDLDVLNQLSADARAAADADYRVASWTGATPEEFLDAVIAANHAISTDAPNGDIAWDPEQWDVARVQELDQRMATSGTAFHSVALTSTGEPAGMTTILVEDGTPARGRQFNTVVLSAHRGRRLGIWLKAVNTAAVARAFPALPYIETWNAAENRHMLAINTELGFRPSALSGGWQLRLPA
jgi:GNAT superfamily N-acetyltransferase